MTTANPTQLVELARQYGTPLWVYDADVIRQRIAELRSFDVIRYAQKACSNVHILKLMRDEGAMVDAVSLGEISRSLAAGFTPDGDPEGVVFTADLVDHATLAAVIEHRITVNAGSLDMLERIGRQAPEGHRVWLRINPGFGHGHSNKTNTGGEHSKHGIWLDDVPLAIAMVRRYGLKLVGLHMHIGSGVDYTHLSRVCDAMVEAVQGLGHDIEAISAGGGLSVPYSEGEPRIDVEHYFRLWDAARKQVEARLGHRVRLEIEPGRFLVAEAGVLVAEVHALNRRPNRQFALVDAGFNDLVRPSFYGSHHEMTVVKGSGVPSEAPAGSFAVAGPLCEAGDVFTQEAGGVVTSRSMPAPEVGDFVVFHDTGAYGAAMSSNYNSRPLAPEVLVENGTPRLIRRRQTIEELIALETPD
ncbi:diaminopimelate decarboxylase [Paraburkholderia sp. SEWSISQ10-3 4]|uniref:diaminopimelate decarboxylase n=1 Tax=Paraburkholderia sp. SEWSISQ10-3 4 TaxID=2937437 RepID=UPI00224DCB40|nr:MULTISPECIES: diaminopimelate decarboxylase [Paraburkholderia]MCX4137324.1 diaminopimelate decarboxylase [Paraburkholderia aspalathi]MDN7170016.1 diaminopimelate decarboxylase [Paraburkholderia sp. SEWSISQ10-3 4]MDQ6499655.1 diaminopimelate decarboxylase [Paraburkholderia aspalathi]